MCIRDRDLLAREGTAYPCLMTGPPGWQTPHYVLASAASVTGLVQSRLACSGTLFAGNPNPRQVNTCRKRRAVVRERLDRWLTPTPVPQRNSPIANVMRVNMTSCLLYT